MDSKDAWNRFMKTGSVESYLDYCALGRSEKRENNRRQPNATVNRRDRHQGEQYR